MNKSLITLVLFALSSIYFSCTSDTSENEPMTIIPTPTETPTVEIPKNEAPTIETPTTETPPNSKTISYLALGDSYTIGQSVCETCKFPEQLKKKLSNTFIETDITLKTIAQTGWTTTTLLSTIDSQKPTNTYDLVTLLIGVNNQFQGKAFTVYEVEFPKLVEKATELAKGNKKNVVVLSIPDYAYTKQGQFYDQVKISKEIDQYNTFAKNYCLNNSITYIDITFITRNGLTQTNLVASDGLHPSEQAYSLFVDILLPVVTEKLKN